MIGQIPLYCKGALGGNRQIAVSTGRIYRELDALTDKRSPGGSSLRYSSGRLGLHYGKGGGCHVTAELPMRHFQSIVLHYTINVHIHLNLAAFTTGNTYISLITFTISEISKIKVTVNTKEYNVQNTAFMATLYATVHTVSCCLIYVRANILLRPSITINISYKWGHTIN